MTSPQTTSERDKEASNRAGSNPASEPNSKTAHHPGTYIWIGFCVALIVFALFSCFIFGAP